MATDSGFGLLEFLLFCQDIRVEPIMAVYSGRLCELQVTFHLLKSVILGLSLDGPVDESDLLPHIQNAIDQVGISYKS